jgi:Asp-tRNA(Asn)/Glu-tRNA(Gln) amidotransferase C subunit
MDDAFDLETLRRAARVAGFDWTDDELDALRPMAQSVLRLLATLETIPLGAIEPTTHYRIV